MPGGRPERCIQLQRRFFIRHRFDSAEQFVLPMADPRIRIAGIKWFHYCLDDSCRWDQLVGCKVEDTDIGRGTVSSVRHRENGNPIVSIDFGASAEFTGDSFSEPEVYVWIDGVHLAQIEISSRKCQRKGEHRDGRNAARRIHDERTVEKFLREFGLWHMTHLSNLPSILRTGILNHHRMQAEPFGYHDISEKSVQRRREGQEPIYKRPIHRYVPLYINPRNPMLYRRRAMQHELCFIEIDRSVILNKRCVVADGNAAAGRTKYFRAVEGLLKLDWNLLRRGEWYDDKEAKRKMCAEVLVPGEVPPSDFLSIRCYDANFLRHIKSEDIPKRPSPELYFPK